MNPWPVARAALRRHWRPSLAMALLVALVTALGTGVGMVERSLRVAAAQAADAFDLVVGAPGSAAQLVLTSVYLQPDTVPLLDGAVLSRVMADPDVAWASPVGFGDQFRGMPIVGVGPDFLTQGGRRQAAEGRLFATEKEAVIGANARLAIGDTVMPQHGRVAMPEAGHVHAESPYIIVGRLPPTGTAWDQTILVPIESVWEVHGLGNGHPAGNERVGPPWEEAAGVPAVVVKPRTLAGAYQLRSRYRTAASTAVFPGEVLASLFRTLGDVRALVGAITTASAILVVAAVFLAFGALVAARARDHAVLRAIGASPGFVVGALWLELGVVLVGGVLGGAALGWLGALAAAGPAGRGAGLRLHPVPGQPELLLAVAVLLGGLTAAALPAVLASRGSVGAALKR